MNAYAIAYIEGGVDERPTVVQYRFEEVKGKKIGEDPTNV